MIGEPLQIQWFENHPRLSDLTTTPDRMIREPLKIEWFKNHSWLSDSITTPNRVIWNVAIQLGCTVIRNYILNTGNM